MKANVQDQLVLGHGFSIPEPEAKVAGIRAPKTK